MKEYFNVLSVLYSKVLYSSLKMAARRNMLAGKWIIKHSKLVKNCAFSWSSFLKLINHVTPPVWEFRCFGRYDYSFMYLSY
jgi:hypothetical protein